MKCSKCGAKIDATTKFCPNCGQTVLNKTEEQKSGGNKKILIIFAICISILIVIMVALIIIFAVFAKKEPDILSNDYSDSSTGEKKQSNDWEEPKGTYDTIVYYNTSNSKDSVSYKESDSSKPTNPIVKYKYKCDGSCKSYSTNSYSDYVVVWDDYNVYMFDGKNNLRKKVSYDPGQAVKEAEILYNNDVLYGCLITEGEYPSEGTSIYVDSLNKITVDKSEGYSIPTFIGDEIMTTLPQDILIAQKNEKSYVLNYKDGSVLHESDEIIYGLANDKNIYYTMMKEEVREPYNYYYYEIYNNKFDRIIPDKKIELASISSKGNIIVNDGSKNFSVYNDEGKLIKTSKNYESVVALGKDYINVVDTDGYLKTVDYDGNVLAKFIKIDKDHVVQGGLSGWFINGDKTGIYTVVEDLTIPSGTKGRGKEFYYSPKTKSQGVIELEELGGYAKPVLYLYPKEDNTNVTVSFEKPALLTTTYPKYNGSWKVTANKNGDLHDKDGKYYYGLYWEEDNYKKVDFSTGFYVTKNNAISFLEEKLSKIGLNDKERNEFIMYWLPILEKNKKSLVYFELTEERQSYNKLNINPNPDSLLRVAIHVKKVNKKTKIEEEKLTEFDRKGFSAVEWGGVQY